MTIDEAIRNNAAPSDFEAFKKFFDLMGIKYEIPSDNLIYLSGFEVDGSQLIVVKFYEDGRFQEFCPYPEEGLTELKELREKYREVVMEGEILNADYTEQVALNGQYKNREEQYKRLLKAAVENIHDILTSQRRITNNSLCFKCSYYLNCTCKEICETRFDLKQ